MSTYDFTIHDALIRAGEAVPDDETPMAQQEPQGTVLSKPYVEMCNTKVFSTGSNCFIYPVGLLKPWLPCTRNGKR